MFKCWILKAAGAGCVVFYLVICTETRTSVAFQLAPFIVNRRVGRTEREVTPQLSRRYCIPIYPIQITKANPDPVECMETFSLPFISSLSYVIFNFIANSVNRVTKLRAGWPGSNFRKEHSSFLSPFLIGSRVYHPPVRCLLESLSLGWSCNGVNLGNFLGLNIF